MLFHVLVCRLYWYKYVCLADPSGPFYSSSPVTTGQVFDQYVQMKVWVEKSEQDQQQLLQLPQAVIGTHHRKMIPKQPHRTPVSDDRALIIYVPNRQHTSCDLSQLVTQVFPRRM